MAGSDQH